MKRRGPTKRGAAVGATRGAAGEEEEGRPRRRAREAGEEAAAAAAANRPRSAIRRAAQGAASVYTMLQDVQDVAKVSQEFDEGQWPVTVSLAQQGV